METQEDLKDINRLLQADPPVIVGGGGSAFVWIKRSLATLVADPTDPRQVPNGAPHPGTKSDYIVYKLAPNLTLAVVSKGDATVPTVVDSMEPRLHSTIFK